MKEINSDHLHKHLDILQGIISRMAANSASCKNYCITLVTALLALAFGQSDVTQMLLYIAYIPIVLFFFLDAYYLSLECYFKGEYKTVVQKWQNDNLLAIDLFSIESSEKGLSGFLAVLKSMKSFSVWPFYLSLLIVVVVLWYFKTMPAVAA